MEMSHSKTILAETRLPRGKAVKGTPLLVIILILSLAVSRATDTTESNGENTSHFQHHETAGADEGREVSSILYSSTPGVSVNVSSDVQGTNGETTIPYHTTGNSHDTAHQWDDQVIFTNEILPLQSDIDFDECVGGKVPQFEAEVGEIHGREGKTAPNDGAVCHWHLAVAELLYLSVVVDVVLDPCDTLWNLVVKDMLSQDGEGEVLAELSCDFKSQVVLASGNRLDFEWHGVQKSGQNRLVFKVRYQATAHSLRNNLTVVYMTPLSGYITSPGYDGVRAAPHHLNAIHYFHAPADYHFLLTLAPLQLPGTFYLRPTERISPYFLSRYSSSAYAYTTARYETMKSIEFASGVIEPGEFYEGFKLMFSFHPPSDEIQCRLSSTPGDGCYNCSVPYYDTFRHHFDCNFNPHCLYRADEDEHCSYSPPGCRGFVGHEHKCYQLYDVSLSRMDYRMGALLPDEAEEHCQREGGALAMMKSPGEWNAFYTRFDYVRPVENVLIGLKSFEMPGLYRHMVQWHDGTLSYSTNFTYTTPQDEEDHRMYFNRAGSRSIERYRRKSVFGVIEPSPFVCQHFVEHGSTYSGDTVQIPDTGKGVASPYRQNQSLIRCPEGHVTHDFLSCDPQTQCFTQRPLRSCKVNATTSSREYTADDELEHPETTVAMYVCDDGEHTVHYTLLCDFREDCPDRSDENLCHHRPDCPEFTCRSGQCVSQDRKCDTVWNCLDGSDEDDCDEFIEVEIFRLPPPAVVDFQYDGLVVQRRLSDAEACPDTHFQCPGFDNYCLPVYVRCNGVLDCLGGEDEADCDTHTCPGFYRCRASSVCVHVQHLCDGISQCPQRDDELLCHVTCPEGCRCQGLAYVCHRPFPAVSYPELRYLDGAGSRMTPRDLIDNFYLVYVNLASCELTELDDVILPNLQTLDVRDNLLTSLSMAVVQFLPNLQILRLAGNPLLRLDPASTDSIQTSLKYLDLSFTLLESFDSTTLSAVPGIETLNISFGELKVITASGFQHLPELQTLDIRGSELRHYPNDLFQTATELHTVYAENYELCCSSMLPDVFDERFCYAPSDEISSCEDLLQSDIYRVFLWTVTLSSLLGNVACIMFRFLEKGSTSKLAFGLFVNNLSVSDLLMGVYLLMIGTADLIYKGSYILHKSTWTMSSFCKAAGFLSLLSSEVSAFMICLITLDRYIVLRFPFSVYHFNRRSATVACCIAWLIGSLLALVPLLPVTSHWDFYGQSGICIPLPITRKEYPGRHYAFGIMIGLNFVLFLLIAAGQGFVYWSIRLNTMATDTTKKSQDMTIARRLITVATSDFLCWFPIGLLGLLAAMGVPIPGEFNVITAVFVLPLNSALNPFLYTYNVLAEKRRKSREIQLLKELETQITTD